MACYYPITAYKKPDGGIQFHANEKMLFAKIELPCGQCVGCRLQRSKNWAIRCVHEAKLHKQNCFITLTYNDSSCPASLIHKHFQDFAKRLRKTQPFRYYMCGEYGDQNGRPHFHACLFGTDFPDKQLYKRLPSGSNLYTSATLERIWGRGFVTIGDVTLESAGYVARYVMKKVTGDAADERYWSLDPYTGEAQKIEPEYNKMSLKPGIGHGFYQRYQSDIYPNGVMIHEGQKTKPPRYYEEKFKLDNPDEYANLVNRRFKQINRSDNTPERLHERELVTKAKLSLKKRQFT